MSETLTMSSGAGFERASSFRAGDFCRQQTSSSSTLSLAQLYSIDDTMQNNSYPLSRKKSTSTSVSQHHSSTFFKTKLCPQLQQKGRCVRGSLCFFAHSQAELRRPPNLTKTKLCPKARRGETCPNEDHGCAFAHSPEELRHTDDIFKTKVCHMWKKGKCNAGLNCRHAHGGEELARCRLISRTLTSEWRSQLAMPPPPPSVAENHANNIDLAADPLLSVSLQPSSPRSRSISSSQQLLTDGLPNSSCYNKNGTQTTETSPTDSGYLVGISAGTEMSNSLVVSPTITHVSSPECSSSRSCPLVEANVFNESLNSLLEDHEKTLNKVSRASEFNLENSSGSDVSALLSTLSRNEFCEERVKRNTGSRSGKCTDIDSTSQTTKSPPSAMLSSAECSSSPATSNLPGLETGKRSPFPLTTFFSNTFVNQEPFRNDKTKSNQKKREELLELRRRVDRIQSCIESMELSLLLDEIVSNDDNQNGIYLQKQIISPARTEFRVDEYQQESSVSNTSEGVNTSNLSPKNKSGILESLADFETSSLRNGLHTLATVSVNENLLHELNNMVAWVEASVASKGFAVNYSQQRPSTCVEELDKDSQDLAAVNYMAPRASMRRATVSGFNQGDSDCTNFIDDSWSLLTLGENNKEFRQFQQKPFEDLEAHTVVPSTQCSPISNSWNNNTHRNEKNNLNLKGSKYHLQFGTFDLGPASISKHPSFFDGLNEAIGPDRSARKPLDYPSRSGCHHLNHHHVNVLWNEETGDNIQGLAFHNLSAVNQTTKESPIVLDEEFHKTFNPDDAYVSNPDSAMMSTQRSHRTSAIETAVAIKSMARNCCYNDSADEIESLDSKSLSKLEVLRELQLSVDLAESFVPSGARLRAGIANMNFVSPELVSLTPGLMFSQVL